MTLEEFNRCAQLQADYLHARGGRKPREMIISPSIRKNLNLGESITLKHIGEIPLVDEPNTPLFMFRGFTYDQLKDTHSTTKTSEELIGTEPKSPTKEEAPKLPAKVEEAPKTTKIPMSQRKRAGR